MSDEAVAQLKQIPWSAALIDDPAWTITRSPSRVPKSTTEDSFIAETLRTERTVSTWVTLRPTEGEGDDYVYKEVRVIVGVGEGVNGHPGILHGGFVATLLDEVCGALIVLNIERKMDRLREAGELDPYANMICFTAYLNTSYKKPVPSSGVLLCTAKFEKRVRNKIYVRATMEDGAGTVYTEGEAMFVEVKAKL